MPRIVTHLVVERDGRARSIDKKMDEAEGFFKNAVSGWRKYFFCSAKGGGSLFFSRKGGGGLESKVKKAETILWIENFI